MRIDFFSEDYIVQLFEARVTSLIRCLDCIYFTFKPYYFQMEKLSNIVRKMFHVLHTVGILTSWDIIVWYARVRHNCDDTLNKLNFGATGRPLDFFCCSVFEIGGSRWEKNLFRICNFKNQKIVKIRQIAVLSQKHSLSKCRRQVGPCPKRICILRVLTKGVQELP